MRQALVLMILHWTVILLEDTQGLELQFKYGDISESGLQAEKLHASESDRQAPITGGKLAQGLRTKKLKASDSDRQALGGGKCVPPPMDGSCKDYALPTKGELKSQNFISDSQTSNTQGLSLTD